MQIARALLGHPVADAALGALSRLDPGRRDVLAVLTYHRIAEVEPGVASGLVSATPRAFERQMELVRDGFHPVSLAEVVARRNGGPPLPARSVLVTFDDAYADFAEIAWPLARQVGVPLTLFVPTGFPDAGQTFWWDRLRLAVANASVTSWNSPVGPLRLATDADRAAAYRALRGHVKALPHAAAIRDVDAIVAGLGAPPAPPSSVLAWADLRRLAAEGVALAPHTRTHPLLTRLPIDEVEHEVRGSRADLLEQTGVDSAAFAYPSGAYTSEVMAAAGRAGVTIGFTTRRGVNALGDASWLALRRINVGGRTAGGLLRLQMGAMTGPHLARAVERIGGERVRPEGPALAVASHAGTAGRPSHRRE